MFKQEVKEIKGILQLGLKRIEKIERRWEANEEKEEANETKQTSVKPAKITTKTQFKIDRVIENDDGSSGFQIKQDVYQAALFCAQTANK
jgi:hypothetical protein